MLYIRGTIFIGRRANCNEKELAKSHAFFC